MKKARLIAVLVIILLACLLFCSCAKINVSYVLGNDGSLSFIYSVELDESYDYNSLSSEDISVDSVKSAVNNCFNEIKTSCELKQIPCEIIDEGYTLTLCVIFDSITDYYLAYGVTGEEIPDPNPEGFSEKRGFLWNVTTDTSVVSLPLIGDVAESYEYYSEYVNQALGIPLDKLTLNADYSYVTKYKSVQTDAEYQNKGEEDGLYYHVWHYSSVEDFDKTISISYKNPNVNGWIILSFILTALVLGIGLTIGILAKKKGKQQLTDKGTTVDGGKADITEIDINDSVFEEFATPKEKKNNENEQSQDDDSFF